MKKYIFYTIFFYAQLLSANDSTFYKRQLLLLKNDSFHLDLNTKNQKLFIDSLYYFIYEDSVCKIEDKLKLLFLIKTKQESYIKYFWSGTIQHKLQKKDKVVIENPIFLTPFFLESCLVVDSLVFYVLKNQKFKIKFESILINDYLNQIEILLNNNAVFDDIEPIEVTKPLNALSKISKSISK